MNKKYQDDKVVIVKRACVNCVPDASIYKLPPDEFINYMNKPCLAYEESEENLVWTKTWYSPLLGGEPFDSYAEAEAARLQFIKDYCIEEKETFEI